MNRFFSLLVLIALVFPSCREKREKKESSWAVPTTTLPTKEEEGLVIRDPENPRDGEHTLLYKSGNIKAKGNYLNGKRHGTWTVWYENGKVWSECGYLEGKKHGKTSVYYKSGVPRYQGQYRNDERVGEWNYFDETGKVVKQERPSK